MCKFINPNKLTFENEMGLPSKPQIKPLLSKEVKQQNNMQFNIMKYEYFKPTV